MSNSWFQDAVAGSGTAVAIGGLGGALQALGHHVERVAPAPDGWPITLRRLRFNLECIPALRRQHYDLVVGFDIDGSGFALAPNAPYVCSIKGVIAEEARHERGQVGWLFRRLAALEGWNARRADRVLTTSQYCADAVHRHYGVPIDRIGIVPEGLDLARWDAALAAAPPRTDARPTVLCVARQYPRKHVADLVAAAAQLRRHLPSLQLRIVGDGPEHARIAQLVAAHDLGATVTLLRNLPFAALAREYAHADVFCLPSWQEGFGIVFVEAMAAGLPVVSTNLAAMPELIGHGTTGILVAPGDPAALAGALAVLLHDPARRAAYGAAGRARAELLTWQLSAACFLNEISAVLR